MDLGRNTYIILSLCFLLGVLKQKKVHAQATHAITGRVSDAVTGEKLSGATLRVLNLEVGTVTDSNGHFILRLPEGEYAIEISFLGYHAQIDSVALMGSVRLTIQLQPGTFQQKEVVISDRQDAGNVTSTSMGKFHLSMDKIKEMPAFMGEVDVLKTLQMLPGVQSGGEGTSGLYVRGGGPSQNLVLLDGAPVYNTGHLFGFFSVFNGDAVKDVTLLKAGMPANYGGRLSSVVDISMKEGNDKELHGKGGVGLIASRFSLEGPLVKNKASFFVSARRTYIDALIKPFVSKSSTFYGSGYYFYDLNAKLNYRISDKDQLYLSGYFGKDYFKFTSNDRGFKTAIPWGNNVATLRWSHLFNDHLAFNTRLIYNTYDFEFNGEQRDFLVAMHSGIDDKTVKMDLSYTPNKNHQIKFGTTYTFHRFVPSTITGQSDEVSFDVDNPFKKYAGEAGIYALDQWQVSSRVKINAGLRFSFFQQVGPYKSYQKNQEGHITDSTVYKRGKPVVNYSGWEPRLIMKYALGNNNSIKASVTRNFQYVHLVSSNTTTLPTDLWVPSTPVVKPEKSWQYALGYYQNFKENMYETSLAVYYKRLNDLIEFSSDYVPSLGDPENDFVFGKAKAYGAELFIHKQKGRLTGWISYTLSRVWRRFPDLNEGKRFPARQDRRHELKIVASYRFNKYWTLSSNFIFQSGNPTTLPEKFYFIEGVLSQAYSHLNSYRLPPYNRLDLSATYHPNPKPDRKFSHSWTFSIYNAYSRLNPYFIYFDTQGNYLDHSLTIQPKKVAIFPIIPAVTWNFEF